jgi:hypothetical protein
MDETGCGLVIKHHRAYILLNGTTADTRVRVGKNVKPF